MRRCVRRSVVALLALPVALVAPAAESQEITESFTLIEDGFIYAVTGVADEVSGIEAVAAIAGLADAQALVTQRIAGNYVAAQDVAIEALLTGSAQGFSGVFGLNEAVGSIVNQANVVVVAATRGVADLQLARTDVLLEQRDNFGGAQASFTLQEVPAITTDPTTTDPTTTDPTTTDPTTDTTTTDPTTTDPTTTDPTTTDPTTDPTTTATATSAVFAIVLSDLSGMDVFSSGPREARIDGGFGADVTGIFGVNQEAGDLGNQLNLVVLTDTEGYAPDQVAAPFVALKSVGNFAVDGSLVGVIFAPDTTTTDPTTTDPATTDPTTTDPATTDPATTDPATTDLATAAAAEATEAPAWELVWDGSRAARIDGGSFANAIGILGINQDAGALGSQANVVTVTTAEGGGAVQAAHPLVVMEQSGNFALISSEDLEQAVLDADPSGTLETVIIQDAPTAQLVSRGMRETTIANSFQNAGGLVSINQSVGVLDQQVNVVAFAFGTTMGPEIMAVADATLGTMSAQSDGPVTEDSEGSRLASVTDSFQGFRGVLQINQSASDRSQVANVLGVTVSVISVP